jgi:hypothetical protein
MGPANAGNPLVERNQKAISRVFEVTAAMQFSSFETLVRPAKRHYSESAWFTVPAAVK